MASQAIFALPVVDGGQLTEVIRMVNVLGFPSIGGGTTRKKWDCTPRNNGKAKAEWFSRMRPHVAQCRLAPQAHARTGIGCTPQSRQNRCGRHQEGRGNDAAQHTACG